MRIDTSLSSLPIFQALASETRLKIIDLLGKKEMNITEIAEKLNISNAITTRHIHQLETAGIIKTERQVVSGKPGTQKVASIALDFIGIDFPEKKFPEYRSYTLDIKLGHYSDFLVEPSCGLATISEIVGILDDPKTFLHQDRVDAELLWLTKGYIEYKIPNIITAGDHIEMIDISFEIASEFPVSNNTWPSDITYYINGQRLGVDRVHGNYSDVRGRLTPPWWPDQYSQYGEMKHIRINQYDTGIDGVPLSSINTKSLKLDKQDFFSLRISSEEGPDVENIGGITLFGEHWGNFPKSIRVKTYVS